MICEKINLARLSFSPIYQSLARIDKMLTTVAREVVERQVGKEAAKQLDEVIKRREDVRLKTQEKQWREYARDAWEISPTLAVFLPSWVNLPTQHLVQEVSRLVRTNPTKVYHNIFFNCEVSCDM